MHRGQLRVWCITALYAPWLVYHWVRRGGFINASQRTNPELPLGGLPIAAKLTRHGTKPPYAPTARLDNEEERTSFLEEHDPPYVIKPLFGARSRNIHRVHDVDPDAYDEPMIIQPYIDGEEYTINIDRHDSHVCYAITKLNQDSDNWHEHTDHTDCSHAVTDDLEQQCEEAAKDIGLRFGRFDVKTPSLEALQDGRFSIIEANGALSLDLTLYTDQSFTDHVKTFTSRWKRYFRAADESDATVTRHIAALFYVVLFPLMPRTASRRWDQINQDDLTPRSQS